MNYELSFERERLDIDVVHGFLTQSYWSPGISKELVARAISHSLCIGAFADGAQVGFARLVTDRATFAYLADVFVLPDHRGHRISERMVEALLALPDVQGLRRIMLATRDAHRLYARFGFSPLAAAERFMEIHRPQIYGAPPALPSSAQTPLPGASG